MREHRKAQRNMRSSGPRVAYTKMPIPISISTGDRFMFAAPGQAYSIGMAVWGLPGGKSGRVDVIVDRPLEERKFSVTVKEGTNFTDIVFDVEAGDVVYFNVVGNVEEEVSCVGCMMFLVDDDFIPEKVHA